MLVGQGVELRKWAQSWQIWFLSSPEHPPLPSLALAHSCSFFKTYSVLPPPGSLPWFSCWVRPLCVPAASMVDVSWSVLGLGNWLPRDCAPSHPLPSLAQHQSNVLMNKLKDLFCDLDQIPFIGIWRIKVQTGKHVKHQSWYLTWFQSENHRVSFKGI